MLKYYRTDPNQVKKVVNDYLDPVKKVKRDRNMRFVNDLMKLDYFKDINHAYNDCTKYDTLKNMLDELPIEHTVLLSNQPKIDMSKIQKENMMQKSMTSEKSIISNTQSTSLHNKYKSQNLNLKLVI